MILSTGSMLLICVLSFVLLCADATRKDHKDPRIYTFAFSNDGVPANFVEAGKLVGQSVDLVKAVCQFAGKRCRTSLVQRSQCWDNTQGFPPYSLVLNNGWYDSCANLPPNPERRLSYTFGGEDFFRTPEPTVIVKSDSKLTIKDLEGCNDLSLAYAANTAVEPDCLLDAGFFVKASKIVPVVTTGVFDLPTIMRTIAEMVKNGSVDLGLVIPRFLSTNGEIKTLMEVPCVTEVPLGLNVMMKQTDAEFIDWWSEAVIEFMCHPKYKKFCRQMDDEYGIDPLCRVPGEDLDCSAYGGPPKSLTPMVPNRISPCNIDDGSETPSAGPECPDPIQLEYGQKYFNYRDKNDRDATKALKNSGTMYIGEMEEDVRFVIQSWDGGMFTVHRLCVTAKDIKSLKFVFRGGERAANEIDVPVESENKWTDHCIDHNSPRRLVVIKFRVAERQTKDPRVKVKNVSMEACVAK